MRIALLLLLASCGVVDTLDGHIDDQANCCAAGTPDRVRACLIRLAPDPTWCWQASCSAPIGEVRALETAEGEILEWCEPAE